MMTEVEVNEKLSQALIKSLEWGNKIPIGVFYQNELISPYTIRLKDKIPNYLKILLQTKDFQKWFTYN